MKIRKYCTGKYIKINEGHFKKYIPVLYTTRGELIRCSLKRMKTATLAIVWAVEWARRVNKLAKGKVAIFSPAKSGEGMENIIFEELG